MGSYSFPLLEDEPEKSEADQLAQLSRSMSLADCIVALRESALRAKEEERFRMSPRSRVITFRMPEDLLARLDAVTDDAATSRGHMLRQIVAEYMCYVEECDIRYKGSLLTAHAAKRRN
jgi:hypothetical protein